jgi:hypothetical protein
MHPDSRFTRRLRACLLVALASTFSVAIVAEHSDAHNPVTSKYDYNRDVFPLLQRHCARCHSEGGSGPMSLMTYKDAVPWAESIREELSAGRMPPWPVDPTSPPVKNAHPISSRDMNTIVVWATGGTPQGNLQQALPEVRYTPTWMLGTPDLEIPMDAEHTLRAGALEEVADFSLSTSVDGTKWVRAADLRPGPVVRDAIISVENGPVLALWQPGDIPAVAPSGTAFRLAPGSKLHLQIHYKKHFDQEQKAASDKSTIGLYFTDPPPSSRELQSITISAPRDAAAQTGSSTFSGTLGESALIVAVRPILDRAYESVNIDAITSSGARVPLLRLRGPRPQWLRRYWLQKQVEVASGSKIEVQVTPLLDYSDEPKPIRQIPLQLALDYVRP